jgi:dephospho-CoA kinase
MFVTNDARLVWNGHHHIGSFVEDDALAGQAAFDARVNSAVDKVLFLVRDFFEVVFSPFHIDMTGGASAHTAAVVVKVDIGLFGNFEDGHVHEYTLHFFGGDIRIFKLKCNGCHKTGAKVIHLPRKICIMYKKRIGITGGIGSGKTTVCEIFAALGIPVYNADHWARWLIQNDTDIRAGIVDIFGPQAYTATDGQYDRKFVGTVVFKDKEKLAQLNALVHPAVERHSQQWHLEQIDAPYTLKEAALMIESGSNRYLDGLIVVTAPEELRITRVVARDGIDAAAVRARIAHQMPESEKVTLANWVINNDGKLQLVPQVWAIHREIVN